MWIAEVGHRWTRMHTDAREVPQCNGATAQKEFGACLPFPGARRRTASVVVPIGVQLTAVPGIHPKRPPLSETQIAAGLALAVKTVQTHAKSTDQKRGFHSRGKLRSLYVCCR